MPDISLEELVAALPNSGFRFPLVRETPELRYVREPEQLFVAPTLSTLREGPISQPLVLVEARAAVGKSTLARHIAWATGSPLWDLSELYVGSGTLWGRLAQGFGSRAFSQVIAALAEGDFLLVVDALDEAELHSAGPSFDAFLTDLGELLVNRPGHPTALVFGRSETIEYLHLYLGAEANVRRCTIEPFGREAADVFLERYLEHGSYSRNVRTAHQRRPTVFATARDRLYQFFSEAISPDRNPSWASDRVRAFLGYAPVLVALAQYLAAYAENYQRLVSDLDSTRAQTTHVGAQWELLTQLMHGILQRENEKFLKQARSALSEIPQIESSDLYTPDEQCSLILKGVSRRLNTAVAPAGLPPRLIDTYMKLVHVALPNHPFLGASSGYANVVMRDYVHAWCLRLGAIEDRKALRQEFERDSYLPSPLLARFFVNLGGAEAAPAIDAQDFGVLYESFIAYREETISVAGDEAGATALIGTDKDDMTVIVLDNAQAGIQLRRRLSEARIRGVSLRMGMPGWPFSIGPNVSVDCELLEVPAAVVQVYPKQGPVEIVARAGYVHLPRPEPEIVVFGAGTVAVSWEDLRYPWVQYQTVLPTETDAPVGPEIHEAFMNLCRITRYFFPLKRALKPLFGPASDNVPRGAVGGTLSASRMYQYLTREQVIFATTGGTYFNPVRLKEMGASLSDIHLRKMGEETLQFLVSYLSSGHR